MATFRPRLETPRELTSQTRRHARHLERECTLISHPQFYDPRVWVREGEKTLTERVKEACADLGNVGELTSVR
jgi:fructose/tagatose bisphosphate aldolase